MQTLEAEVVDEKLEVDFAVDHEEKVVHLMQSCKIHLDILIENKTSFHAVDSVKVLTDKGNFILISYLH